VRRVRGINRIAESIRDYDAIPEDDRDNPTAGFLVDSWEEFLVRLRVSAVGDILDPRRELTDRERAAFTIRLWGGSARSIHRMATSDSALIVSGALLSTQQQGQPGQECSWAEVAKYMSLALASRVDKSNARKAFLEACGRLEIVPDDARYHMINAIALLATRAGRLF